MALDAKQETGSLWLYVISILYCFGHQPFGLWVISASLTVSFLRQSIVTGFYWSGIGPQSFWGWVVLGLVSVEKRDILAQSLLGTASLWPWVVSISSTLCRFGLF